MSFAEDEALLGITTTSILYMLTNYRKQKRSAKLLIVTVLLVLTASAFKTTHGQDTGNPGASAERKESENLFDMPDWERIFLPTTPLLETLVRGSVTYLAIFFLLRVVLKREAGTLGMTDLLVVVMLADAIQNGLANDYHSVTDGILLVIVILSWSHFLNFLGFHFPLIQKLIHPPPLLLVKNGRLIRGNLRKEFITEDELISQIREQGVGSIADVKEAYMEMDGRISVLANTERLNGSKKKII